jgi:magnesium chelatase family protein
MIATILSRAQYGMDAPLVNVEVDIANGLPSFTIVGLPEAVVKESKDRVRAALANSHFELPSGRITVNLAPADLPKEGGRFDLPIAIGILVASGQLAAKGLADCELYGELSLSGELRPITGALIAALAATQAGRSLIVPIGNGDETRLIVDCKPLAAGHLLQVCAHLNGQQALSFADQLIQPTTAPQLPDLCEVRGQEHAKRALEIAAAGEHSLLFMGPPGTGKSMLAQRLPGILPPLTEDEALQTAAVRSLMAAVLTCRSGAFAHSVRLTTRLLPSHWWAVVRSLAPAKFRWRTTESCSWMNFPSSIAGYWKCCANRWRAARSAFRVLRGRLNFQRVFSCSPP